MIAHRSTRQHLVVKLFLLVVLCAVLLPVPGASQVTFSRDWNAGKRAASDVPGGNGECAAIWHAVTKNIQHLTLCETRALLKSMQTDDSSIETNNGNNLPIFANTHI
ncbi:adipokinetic hormone/corazonin-related peptide-like [Anopheles aquasalis]|uniref:adipokinetic hormone/corazonin-related peptide-like n=1 Tax=Anopheles aquasalis TaxID=42839 RepID=UPI00215B60E7|nr:adipokinetic hormone/corazonin-related peptide-like [Anopheles aquasalis]